MDKIDKFDIKRLLQLIKYGIRMERKRFLALLKVYTIIMGLPFIIGIISETFYSGYYLLCIDILPNIQTSAIVVTAGTIFNIMETPEGRKQYLMLPAANSEKLAAQVIIYTIVPALLLLSAYIIIEAAHYPIVALLGKPQEFRESIAPIFFHFITFKSGWMAAVIITLFGATIYNCFVNIRCRGHNWLTGSLMVFILIVAFIFSAKASIDLLRQLIPSHIIVVTTTIILGIINYKVWRNSLKNFNKLTIS